MWLSWTQNPQSTTVSRENLTHIMLDRGLAVVTLPQVAAHSKAGFETDSANVRLTFAGLDGSAKSETGSKLRLRNRPTTAAAGFAGRMYAYMRNPTSESRSRNPSRKPLANISKPVPANWQPGRARS